MRRQTAGPDSGAAAVEFALVSVVLFTLLFGIIQYGFYFFQATSVASFTAQAGRLAAVRDDCADWVDGLDMMAEEPGLLGGVRRATTSGSAERGDLMTVTVAWEPTAVGIVPLPPAEANQQTTVVRAERLGGVADDGCSWP